MAVSKYETHILPNLDRIAAWARQGADQKELCKKLGVAERTFRSYLAQGKQGAERYKELAQVWVQSCQEPDDQVEAALYRSATGYTVKVVKQVKIRKVEYDENTGKRIRETEKLVPAEEDVHVPANSTAQIFWLTNRRPERWKHKPVEREETGSGSTGVVEMPLIMENPGPPEVAEDGK